jgi:hypothetical protein
VKCLCSHIYYNINKIIEYRIVMRKGIVKFTFNLNLFRVQFVHYVTV